MGVSENTSELGLNDKTNMEATNVQTLIEIDGLDMDEMELYTRAMVGDPDHTLLEKNIYSVDARLTAMNEINDNEMTELIRRAFAADLTLASRIATTMPSVYVPLTEEEELQYPYAGSDSECDSDYDEEITMLKRGIATCAEAKADAHEPEDNLARIRLLGDEPFRVLNSSFGQKTKKPKVTRAEDNKPSNTNTTEEQKIYLDELRARCDLLFDSEWVRCLEAGSIFTQVDPNNGRPMAFPRPMLVCWRRPVDDMETPEAMFGANNITNTLRNTLSTVKIPSIGSLEFRGGNVIGVGAMVSPGSSLSKSQADGHMIRPLATLAEVVLGIHPKVFPLPLPPGVCLDEDGNPTDAIPDPDRSMTLIFRDGSTYHLITASPTTSVEGGEDAQQIPCRLWAAGLTAFLEEAGFTLLVSTDGLRHTVVDNLGVAYSAPPHSINSHKLTAGEQQLLSPAALAALGVSPLQSGLLFKQGTGLIKKWQERFFVVNGSQIDYYAYKPADKSSLQLQGSVQVDEDTEIIDYTSDAHSKRSHVFGLRPEGSKRIYVLDAGSKQGKDAWIEFIQSQYKIKKPITTMGPENKTKEKPGINKEGFLAKRGGISRLSWQRRFVQHTGTTMRYFSLKNTKPSGERQEAGVIPLPKATITQQGKVFIVSPEGSKKTYQFQAMNDQDCNDWVNSIRPYTEMSVADDVPFLQALRRQRGIDDDAPLDIHVGFLQKHGSSKASSWRERFFVLDNVELELYYFVKFRDREPIGCVTISRHTKVEKYDKNPHVLILTPKENGRRYPLLAKDESSVDEWVHVITNAIEQAKLRPDDSLGDSKSFAD